MKDDINGRWTGKLSYDLNYPEAFKTALLFFEMVITKKGNKVTGFCTDDLTKKLNIASAYIEGVMEEGIIDFIKKYPCRISYDKKGKPLAQKNTLPNEIVYHGKLKTRVKSHKLYFKGFWTITTQYLNKDGQFKDFICGGKWTMQKD